MMAITQVLNKLAELRLIEIRREYNRAFMSEGPGVMWERWKRDSQQMAMEEKLLAEHLGKESFDWYIAVDG